MGYKIRQKKHESLAESVQRVAKKRLDSACKKLAKADSDLNESVHETRKDLKKLRALLRLVRESLGKKAYKKENKTYRDAARALAPFRDSWVRLTLVQELRDRQEDELLHEALEMMAKQLRAEYEEQIRGNAVPDAINEAADLLTSARKRIDDWPLPEEGGFDLFRGGLEKVYRRGLKGLRRSLSNPSAENLHEWRKRCKYLRHQMDLLHPAYPKLLLATEDSLHDLTDFLGDDHDLAVLRETLESELRESLTNRQLQVLNEEIAMAHRKYTDRCWPLGRCLFAETPETFVRRIEAYWNS